MGHDVALVLDIMGLIHEILEAVDSGIVVHRVAEDLDFARRQIGLALERIEIVEPLLMSHHGPSEHRSKGACARQLKD